MNAFPPEIKSALHTEALRLAGEGIPIFPCVPRTKKPATPNGFHDATTDAEVISAWWTEHPDYNIAFQPQRAGLAVIDPDGEAGLATWAELELLHGSSPETMTVRTPRGGLHLYFKGDTPPTQGTLGPHIDTRGGGSYVLVPPSVFYDPATGLTGSYTYENDLPPAELPAWIPSRITELAAAVKEASDVPLDLEVNVYRARNHLNRMVAAGDVAIEGEMGDVTTYKTAAMVLDYGLSPEKVGDLMIELWNPSCVPPWDEDALRSKIENASRYAQNGEGAWASGDTLQTFAAALGKLGVDRMAPANDHGPGPVPFGDLMGREVPPVQFLIDGLVERGTVTFFAGHGGTHKSRVALQWGLSISAGQDVFGRRVEPARFLYLSYEDDRDEVARRTQKIAQRLGLAAAMDQADYWDLTGQDAPLAVIRESGEVVPRPHWDLLREHLSATPGHTFLVIDSTYNALRFEGAAKINEGAVMAGIGTLQRLCLETNCTIVCLWHPSQAGQERGDNSGWSVAWHNGPRARISLTADKDRPDTFELKVEKQNHGPKGAPVTLHWADGVLLPQAAVSGADYAAKLEDAAVAAAVAAAEQGMPLQKQRRPFKWVFDEVEKACGHRPKDRELKEILATALHHGKLRYVAGSKEKTAGYYPLDLDTADDMAREAKRRTAEAA